jgi:hypothetical protein
MDVLWWVLMPFVVSAGSAVLTFIVMHAHTEAIQAKNEKELIEAQIALACQQRLMAERVKAGEEAAKRKALDDFLADVRVEERHYVRESKSLLANRRYLILQERIYFRNIPLSGWVEKQLLIEEGSDLERLARASSAFIPDKRLSAPTVQKAITSPK